MMHVSPSTLTDALRRLLATQHAAPKRGPKVLLHGSFRHTMDRKGRVVLPGALLDVLPEPILMTRALPGYLIILAQRRFPNYAAAWLEQPDSIRRWLSGVQVCPVDPSTRRIMVPKELRDWAGLNPLELPEVALAGVGDAVLLCEASRWDAEVLAAHEALLGGGK